MTAADLLERSGLDTTELEPWIRPIRPESVTVSTAPNLMRLLWARGVQAMTLGDRIYVHPRALAGSPRSLGLLIIHELVHVRQWHEQGVIGFSTSYLGGYLSGRRGRRGHDGAYREIEQEREARSIAARFA